MRFIRAGLKLDRRTLVGPFWDVDSSLVFKYHLEAGMDAACLESLPGDSDLMYAALRGASRGYGKKEFGAHIAMSWYGGARLDPLWFKRWKVALYFSYLSGATSIFSEGGHFSNKNMGNNCEFDSVECKEFRRILREFHMFCERNPRAPKGPLVKIGIAHGHLDGFPGLWSNWVWGNSMTNHGSMGRPNGVGNIWIRFIGKTYGIRIR